MAIDDDDIYIECSPVGSSDENVLTGVYKDKYIKLEDRIDKETNDIINRVKKIIHRKKNTSGFMGFREGNKSIDMNDVRKANIPFDDVKMDINGNVISIQNKSPNDVLQNISSSSNNNVSNISSYDPSKLNLNFLKSNNLDIKLPDIGNLDENVLEIITDNFNPDLPNYSLQSLDLKDTKISFLVDAGLNVDLNYLYKLGYDINNITIGDIDLATLSKAGFNIDLPELEYKFFQSGLDVPNIKFPNINYYDPSKLNLNFLKSNNLDIKLPDIGNLDKNILENISDNFNPDLPNYSLQSLDLNDAKISFLVDAGLNVDLNSINKLGYDINDITIGDIDLATLNKAGFNIDLPELEYKFFESGLDVPNIKFPNLNSYHPSKLNLNFLKSNNLDIKLPDIGNLDENVLENITDNFNPDLPNYSLQSLDLNDAKISLLVDAGLNVDLNYLYKLGYDINDVTIGDIDLASLNKAGFNIDLPELENKFFKSGLDVPNINFPNIKFPNMKFPNMIPNMNENMNFTNVNIGNFASITENMFSKPKTGNMINSIVNYVKNIINNIINRNYDWVTGIIVGFILFVLFNILLNKIENKNDII